MWKLQQTNKQKCLEVSIFFKFMTLNQPPSCFDYFIARGTKLIFKEKNGLFFPLLP